MFKVFVLLFVIKLYARNNNFKNEKKKHWQEYSYVEKVYESKC